MATKYQVKKATQPAEPQQKPAFKPKVKVREINEPLPVAKEHNLYPFKNKNVWVENNPNTGERYLSVSSQGIGIRTWGQIDKYCKEYNVVARFR